MKTHILTICLFLGFLAVISSGCSKADSKDGEVSEMKFDKRKWSEKDGREHPYRERMLNDLIASDTLKKLDMNGVVELLGPPKRVDKTYLFYEVSQERIGFFPLHTTSLVIKCAPDSSVTWVKIHK